MSYVIHRQPLNLLPAAVHADGIYITDSDGNRYLDASGGAAVSNLGHSHPAIVEAVQRQVSNLAYAHTSFFTTGPLEELGDRLNRLAQGGPQYTFFSNSGSEAIEAAAKIARQYFYERGETGRTHFIARSQSYHGGTIGALSIGRQMLRRRPYEPILSPSHHIAPFYPYRFRRQDESDQEYALRAANDLERKILELGPNTVIGFFAETVGGATAGVLIPNSEYLQRIRKICDKYGILLILDEVMCGMGRIGDYFAFNRFGVKPDIVAIGKGLGGGYQPIAATVCSKPIYEAVSAASGLLHHGSTYSGHAVGCAAANAILDTIETNDLLTNVRQQGETLLTHLRNALGDHPNVGNIRGIGLFIGVEFVADKSSKQPLPPELKFNGTIKRAAIDNRLLCYAGGGTVDGARGDHVIIAPPFIIDESDTAEIAERFSRAVAQASSAI